MYECISAAWLQGKGCRVNAVPAICIEFETKLGLHPGCLILSQHVLMPLCSGTCTLQVALTFGFHLTVRGPNGAVVGDAEGGQVTVEEVQPDLEQEQVRQLSHQHFRY